MILFATRSANTDKLNAHCIPGITASMAEGARYLHLTAKSDSEDIFPTLSRFMRDAKADPSVEALALLHDDLELRDPYFRAKVRKAFGDPSVAIIGCIGACNVKSLNWWEGSPRYGACVDGLAGVREWGFGSFGAENDRFALVDVDSVDGMLLILSPWAIANLRLDGLGYEGLHGYAEELCFQARARGKRVVVTRIELTHHTKGGIAGDPLAFERCDANFRKRWFGPPPPPMMRKGFCWCGKKSVIDNGWCNAC